MPTTWKLRDKKKGEKRDASRTYQEIRIEFSEDQEYKFNNRDENNLPKDLQGEAKWRPHKDKRRLAYSLPFDRKSLVEYITNEWYFITWDKDAGKDSVSLKDIICIPAWQLLGTTDIPAGVKATDDTEETSEPRDKDSLSYQTDKDTPVVTRQQSRIIDSLADQLSETIVPRLWPTQTPVIHPMAMQTIAKSNVEAYQLRRDEQGEEEGGREGAFPRRNDGGGEGPGAGDPSGPGGPGGPGDPGGHAGGNYPQGPTHHGAGPQASNGWCGRPPDIFDGDRKKA